MANQIPTKISAEIKILVREAADLAKYTSMSRTESGQFMDQLVKRRDVGGRIAEFIPRAEVRTYIKDGILNAYSKQKVRETLPSNSEISELISNITRQRLELVEENKNVKVFGGRADECTIYCLVSVGTFIKWETALRKLLLASQEILSRSSTVRVERLTILTAQGKMVTQSEKRCVAAALKLANCEVHFVS